MTNLPGAMRTLRAIADGSEVSLTADGAKQLLVHIETLKMIPITDAIADAMAWLSLRGGPFYPSAAVHVETIVAHIRDLERQIENLIASRPCPVQGPDEFGKHS